jgi:hypothetical protein
MMTMNQRKKFTVRLHGWKQEVIRPAHVTSFGVALEFFANAQPGEHYEEPNTYRYFAPNWGWVYVSWEDYDDDH